MRAVIIDELTAIIESSPLGSRVEEVMALARPALRLQTTPVDQEELPPGASRMGGIPDLPPDMPWPISRGRPLEFLAQIDLIETAAILPLPGLPTAGWLAAFRNVEARGGGRKSDWRLLHFEGEAVSLVRTEPPAPEIRGHFGWLRARGPAPAPAHRFEACEIGFEYEDCLPGVFDLVRAFGPKNDDEADDAWEFLDERLESWEDRPFHRLGGYPMLVQSKMSDIVGWELLLQIDSDEDGPDWMWGDAGRLHYLMQPMDLAGRRFERAWCSEEFH